MSAAPKFSFYTISFKGEAFARSVERLARLGFDAVEVPGDPEKFSGDEVSGALTANGIKASAVCGRMYGPERDLSTADVSNRAKAIDYYRRAAEFAGHIRAPILIVAPTSVRRTLPETTVEQEWAAAVESISQIADSCRGSGVKIAIEPWNRYETYLVNRLEQADQMRRDVGRDNVGIMADLFHMNIEEIDAAAAIRDCGSSLLNVHFADSNRQAPGRGHIDLLPLMSALQSVNYEHYLSAELLPPRYLIETTIPSDFYDRYPEETISELRRAWRTAKGRAR